MKILVDTSTASASIPSVLNMTSPSFEFMITNSGTWAAEFNLPKYASQGYRMA